MCSGLCKDFYVVYQLEMVAGEVESSCQLVVTFFFFFLVSPYQTVEISLGQPSPPSYQLLPPLLVQSKQTNARWLIKMKQERSSTHAAILVDI